MTDHALTDRQVLAYLEPIADCELLKTDRDEIVKIGRAIIAVEIDRLNAEWMAKCEELRKFVDEIAAGRIDPDKIAGKARSLVEMAKKEGA